MAKPWCSGCGAEFSSQEAKKKHQKTCPSYLAYRKSVDDNPQTCEWCGKKLKNYAAWRRHVQKSCVVRAAQQLGLKK